MFACKQVWKSVFQIISLIKHVDPRSILTESIIANSPNFLNLFNHVYRFQWRFCETNLTLDLLYKSAPHVIEQDGEIMQIGNNGFC